MFLNIITKNNKSDLRKMVSRRGFTLIELLVVISIIGSLSSIVLSSVTETRKKALDVRQREDLHQIQLALECMLSDGMAIYVPAGGAGAVGDYNAAWSTFSNTIINSKCALSVPSSTSFSPSSGTLYGYSWWDWHYVYNYYPAGSALWTAQDSVNRCVLAPGPGPAYDLRVRARTLNGGNDGGILPKFIEIWGGSYKIMPSGTTFSQCHN